MLGGYRNTMTMVITGLDIEAKAAHAEQLLFGLLGGAGRFKEADVRLLRYDHPDAPSNDQATAHLRVTVKDADESKVGRFFSNASVELALAGYAGFHTTTPPTAASAFGVYWPALVPATAVTHTVHLPDGSTQVIPQVDPAAGGPGPSPARARARAAAAGGPGSSPAGVPGPSSAGVPGRAAAAEAAPGPAAGRAGAAGSGAGAGGELVRVPLGWLCGARSGDKGGNANVGLWTRTAEEYAWLRAELTVPRFRELLTEAADLEVRRYELANLNALNFVVVGLLGAGVAATTRPDAQAKGLGEYLRSRTVLVPASLLPATPG
jgi:hypothetical protein